MYRWNTLKILEVFHVSLMRLNPFVGSHCVSKHRFKESGFEHSSRLLCEGRCLGKLEKLWAACGLSAKFRRPMTRNWMMTMKASNMERHLGTVLFLAQIDFHHPLQDFGLMMRGMRTSTVSEFRVLPAIWYPCSLMPVAGGFAWIFHRASPRAVEARCSLNPPLSFGISKEAEGGRLMPSQTCGAWKSVAAEGKDCSKLPQWAATAW